MMVKGMMLAYTVFTAGACMNCQFDA